LGILIAGFVGGRAALDEKGWISQEREPVIVAHPSWMVGESKSSSNVIPPTYDVTKTVFCEGLEEHTVKITFHGRRERPDAKDRFGVSWKCVRRSDSFECDALD
jgi:hypothetical protein